jgi:ribosomal protein L34E
MFSNYLQIKRHAVCALCGREVSCAGTAARVEKALRAVGWQEIELQTPTRVYGGLACPYCVETFCEEGVFQTDRDEWQVAVEATAGRKSR